MKIVNFIIVVFLFFFLSKKMVRRMVKMAIATTQMMRRVESSSISVVIESLSLFPIAMDCTSLSKGTVFFLSRGLESVLSVSV